MGKEQVPELLTSDRTGEELHGENFYITIRQKIDDRYSRARINVATPNRRRPKWGPANVESVKRPLWLKDVAEFAMVSQECRDIEGLDEKGNYVDPAAQLEDKLRVLSDPLRIHSEAEIDVFNKLQKSGIRFWRGYGFTKNPIESEAGRIPSDAEYFVNETEVWLGWGIKPESITGWFRSIGGLAIIDPSLFKQFFSDKGVFSGVKPLGGMTTFLKRELNKLENKEGLRSKEKPVSLEEVLSGVKDKPERVKLALDTLIIEKEAASALDRFYVFCRQVSSSIEGVLEYYDPKIQKGMESIANAAKSQADFLEIMRVGNYADVRLERPTSYENLIVPVSVALAESLSSRPKIDQDTPEIVDRLISAIRRRRIDVDDIHDLCAAFQPHQDLDVTQTTIEDIKGDKTLLRDGLAIISALLGNSPYKEEVIKTVTEEIIPKFILELRIRGIETRAWTEDDYIRLGLGYEIWEEHKRRVQEAASFFIPGREEIKPGSIVIEWSTQAAPFHISHEESLRGITRITLKELEVAGIVPTGFSGDLALIIRVNRGNPGKPQEEPIDLRYSLVVTALKDAGRSGRLFIYSPDDINAPNVERFRAHEEWFASHGKQLVGLARYTGADALTKDGVAYEKDDTSLNERLHIINMQGYQLSDLFNVGDYWRLVFQNFRSHGVGVIIELSQVTDVHSSDIREGLKDGQRGYKITDKVLQTLVHPQNVESVKKHWGQINKEV